VSGAGWQPIATAPKEIDVLVFAYGRQYVAEYFEYDDDCGWYVNDNKNGPYPLRGGDPTDWMPLPAPPVTI